MVANRVHGDGQDLRSVQTRDVVVSLRHLPTAVDAWQTAAALPTHVFFLMGTLVMLPIILGYTKQPFGHVRHPRSLEANSKVFQKSPS